MVRPWVTVSVVLPLLGAVLYLLAHRLGPGKLRDMFIFSERGVIELGTAAFYASAGCAAFALFAKGRDIIPRRYRTMFLLFALAAWFVALEEVSYGQHLVGWSSPSWFQRNNATGETNIHNLYDNLLSRRLRTSADIAYSACCVVLPCWLHLRRRLRPRSHSTYYLAPGTELITLVTIAMLATTLDKFVNWAIGVGLFISPGVYKELYLGAATMLYTAAMRRRLIPNRANEHETIACPPALQPSRPLRLAA